MAQAKTDPAKKTNWVSEWTGGVVGVALLLVTAMGLYLALSAAGMRPGATIEVTAPVTAAPQP